MLYGFTPVRKRLRMKNELFDLYDPDIKKIIIILDCLEEMPDKIDVKLLSERTNLSKITVMNYLNQISNYIEMTNSDKLELSFINKNQFIWRVHDIYQYLHLRNFIIQNCSIIQLSVRLLLGNQVNKEDFLEEFFLSESTFKRRYRQLKNIFKHYNLSIKSNNGDLCLLGEEAVIRRVARDQLIDLFVACPWPFEEFEESLMEEHLLRALRIDEVEKMDQDYFINADMLKIMKYDLAIQWIRIENGHCISLNEGITKNISFFRLLMEQDILTVPEHFEDYTEKIYFMCSLLAKDIFYLLPISEVVQEELQSLQPPIYQFVSFAIKEFEQIVLPITQEQKQDVFPIILSIHLANLIYPNWRGSTHYQILDARVPSMNRAITTYLNALEAYDESMIIKPIDMLKQAYEQIIGYITDYSVNSETIFVAVRGTNSILEMKIAERIIEKTFSFFYNIEFDAKNPDIIIHMNQHARYLFEDKQRHVLNCFISSSFVVEDMNLIRRALSQFLDLKIKQEALEYF